MRRRQNQMTSPAVGSLRYSFPQELQQIEPAKLMRYRAAGLFDKKFTVARLSGLAVFARLDVKHHLEQRVNALGLVEKSHARAQRKTAVGLHDRMGVAHFDVNENRLPPRNHEPASFENG